MDVNRSVTLRVLCFETNACMCVHGVALTSLNINFKRLGVKTNAHGVGQKLALVKFVRIKFQKNLVYQMRDFAAY